MDLYDELKVELDGIVAEVEELGSPATRLSFEVNQEELRLFLKSRIKSSEDTPITGKHLRTYNFKIFYV